MKTMRCLEILIFESVFVMGVFDVMPLKICAIIGLLISLIAIISERKYYNNHVKPWVDILSMFYFFKALRIETNKLYLTKNDKVEIDANTIFMRKYGNRILEQGEKVINNPQISVAHRNEVKQIMEDVRQILETEKLL